MLSGLLLPEDNDLSVDNEVGGENFIRIRRVGDLAANEVYAPQPTDSRAGEADD